MAYHYNPQNAAYNFEWQLSDFPVGTEAWEVGAHPAAAALIWMY